MTGCDRFEHMYINNSEALGDRYLIHDSAWATNPDEFVVHACGGGGPTRTVTDDETGEEFEVPITIDEVVGWLTSLSTHVQEQWGMRSHDRDDGDQIVAWVDRMAESLMSTTGGWPDTPDEDDLMYGVDETGLRQWILRTALENDGRTYRLARNIEKCIRSTLAGCVADSVGVAECDEHVTYEQWCGSETEWLMDHLAWSMSRADLGEAISATMEELGDRSEDHAISFFATSEAIKCRVGDAETSWAIV